MVDQNNHNIRLLPTLLINQIAAGEVIERPASVVKELIENAIDAQADEITITLIEGGKALILVEDNGIGMDRDNLILSIKRHATSKLPYDDLSNITSLGFRGEALPSIASIARMQITSKMRHTDSAWELYIEGSDEYTLKPTRYHQYGTRIEIRDLFFATPARLKFLKSNTREKELVKDHILRLALNHPHIHFRLKDQTKIVYDWPKRDTIHLRIKDIFGSEFYDNTYPVIAEKEYAKLSGFIGLPTFHKTSSLYQYVFVNNRPIKDRALQAVIRVAYQDFISHDRFPVVFLYFDLPTNEVDVNVHPAKSEVRFRDTSLIKSLIIGGIRNTLSTHAQKTSTTTHQATLHKFTPRIASSIFPSPSPGPTPLAYNMFQEFAPQTRVEPEADIPPLTPHTQFPLGAAKAQISETYILAQTETGIVLVDQHAAHERLVYENMKTMFKQNGISRQMLLIPEVVELDKLDKERLLERSHELAEFGLIIDSFGPTSIVIREIPALFNKIDLQSLIKDLADEIKEYDVHLSLKEKFEHICGNIACRSSVRAGRKLSIDEMNALLRQMEQTPHSGQCNHGRPTYVELKFNDIERLFGRKD